ncbi:MAG: MFS transporter [Pseudomonadales bacterium]|jgi:MFS family permease
MSNRPLRWYLTSTAFYLVPGGIQMVLFPWLVAVYLHESAERVGMAQMASQLPMLLLILFGGLVGDRMDQRRLLVGLQLGMMLPPLIMAGVIASGHVVYEWLIAWAVVGGSFGAFAQPARDALLNRVAGTEIQRVVTMAIGVQFGIQVIGFALGSTADRVGAPVLLVGMAGFLLLAALTTSRIPRSAPVLRAPRRHPLREIAEGLAMAWRSSVIRPCIVQTFAVGVFFAGSYMVILPLMVRDLYSGSAGGIAMVFAANMLGTCTTILFLIRRGGVARPGRALLSTGLVSCAVLSLLHYELPEWLFYAVVYAWGMGGGISMTMSRAIVQEAAPDTHRARLMSVYSLGMMGGMPIGSVLLGWCVGQFGVRDAVFVPVVGMALVVVLLLATSRLWWAERMPQETADEASPGADAAAG